jgi:amidase/aspartyl-tRNA(Asn)/glutamyl-tRNA(Gln) amidotransferase subunit A
VTALTNQYGRLAPGESEASFASAIRLSGGIPGAARFEGEQRRRRLIVNYTKALRDHSVDFMLVMSLGDVIDLRTGAVGFPVYRAYYQVPNVLGWPKVSFPAGYVKGAMPVTACRPLYGLVRTARRSLCRHARIVHAQLASREA